MGTFGYLACGRCMERFGRRPTALVGFAAGLGCTVVLFQTADPFVSFFALLGGVFFGLGMSPVMSAFTTELFPTEIRGQRPLGSTMSSTSPAPWWDRWPLACSAIR